MFCIQQILRNFCTDQKIEKDAPKCHRHFGDFHKDVLVQTDAKFSTYTVSFIMGLKEERRCKTEGRRKKDEMVGLEPTNGQV